MIHLDPDSEPGMGGEYRDEGGSFQVEAGDRPDFDGGSDDSSPTVAAAERQTPADPNNRVQHTPAAAPRTAEEWTSIRDAAQAAGFDFGHGVTDAAAALNLLLQKAQASRQQSMYEQLGRQLAPRAQEIQQLLGSRQAAPAAAPTRKPWEAPEFDRRWASLVERDPATGLFFSKPGTPPEIAEKVNEYVAWKDRFDSNPYEVMREAFKEEARAEAQVMFQQQFAEQQRQSEINRIVAENQSWMYQKDQVGNVLRNFDGQPIQTPHGARYCPPPAKRYEQYSHPSGQGTATGTR